MFFDTPMKFQVIKNDLPLGITGILGVDFLKSENAEVSFHHNTLVTSSRPSRPITFINYKPGPPAKYTLLARSKTPITIKLQPTELTTGYLSRLETPTNVFIGNALVTNFNNTCCVYAINSNKEDIDLEIPPQEV